jgi:uncharacterized membrane-anchored protein
MAENSRQLDHPLRHALSDEVHARPPDDLATPSNLYYIARIIERGEDPDIEIGRVNELLRHFDQPEIESGTRHATAQLDDLRLRWERHSEFARYAFIGTAAGGQPFAATPTAGIPADWLDKLQGDVIAATEVSVVPMKEDSLSLNKISQELFSGNPLIGSQVADGRAIAVTDFRVPDNGFMKLLILNDAMPDAQTGRFVQRLLELDTYRLMALLALPVAQSLTPKLNASEEELVTIYESLVRTEPNDETELLNRLTQLATENQQRHARSDYRFAAANAYYEIVLQRISELREVRLPGVQTFDEFTTRRLTPAIKTCRAVFDRQQSLVLRMARATQLLSTRIDVDRQHQNQQLLASMDRRAKSQLRLQATVEGLSVAAVTYYVVGLVTIMVEGLQSTGLPLSPEMAAAVSIPLVAGIAFYGVRRIRRRISQEDSA